MCLRFGFCVLTDPFSSAACHVCAANSAVVYLSCGKTSLIYTAIGGVRGSGRQQLFHVLALDVLQFVCKFIFRFSCLSGVTRSRHSSIRKQEVWTNYADAGDKFEKREKECVI